MKIKYSLLFLVCMLVALAGRSNAAVIQDECLNLDDGYGGYYGVSCNFKYSFNVVGTVQIQAAGIDAPPSVFSIFGTLTQDGWYEEDYYGGSNSGETTTLLNLNLGDVLSTDLATTVQYSMSRVDTIFDFNTTIGAVSESLANTPYAIANPSDWLIETDGVNLVLDLTGGMSLIAPDLPELLATTQLSAVPVPAAVWLFASGFIALIGFTKRKQS